MVVLRHPLANTEFRCQRGVHSETPICRDGIGVSKAQGGRRSGLKIREKYSKFDAKVKYKDILSRIKNQESRIKNPGCICGEILRGLKEPKDCKLFNKKCTSENPIGACMVSSEGACGIEAKYLG